MTLYARNLPAAVTGACAAEANPLEGPAGASTVRGTVAHDGSVGACRERFPRELTGRE